MSTFDTICECRYRGRVRAKDANVVTGGTSQPCDQPSVSGVQGTPERTACLRLAAQARAKLSAKAGSAHTDQLQRSGQSNDADGQHDSAGHVVPAANQDAGSELCPTSPLLVKGSQGNVLGWLCVQVERLPDSAWTHAVAFLAGLVTAMAITVSIALLN